MIQVYMLMKQLLLFSIFLFGIKVFSVAQTADIPSTTSSNSATTYGPIYRTSTSSTINYARFAYIFTPSELSSAGISSGDTIKSLAWNKANSAAGNTNRKGTFKIYLKNSSTSSYSSDEYWSTLTSGATEVYANTTYVQSSSTGFITFTFSTDFVYTGGSLEVLTDWKVNAGTQSPGGPFNWYYSSATGKAIGVASTSSQGTLSDYPNGDYRPDIRIGYTEPLACTNPPNAGNVVTALDTICANTDFWLTLSGNSGGTGETYQWESSTDNSSWNTISGATNDSLQVSITANTYYRCIVTCGQSSTTPSKLITKKNFYECYCIPSSNGAACITNVEFSALLNNSGNCSNNAYGFYPQTTTVYPGDSLPMTITTNDNAVISLWIDYDHDSQFEASEWTQITLASNANQPVTKYIVIPMNADTGVTGMRIRSRTQNTTNNSGSACTSFTSGECEDYLITISSSPVCTNPPTAGVAVTTDSIACSGVPFMLSLSGNSIGSGQTYQWQSSSDNANWTNISGATAEFLTTTQLSPSFYQCEVTCGQSVSSGSVYVNQNYFMDCYCEPVSFGYTCITQVTFDTLIHNSSSSCSSPSYGLYTAPITTLLTQGDTIPLFVTCSDYAKLSVWIDFDHDGQYEPSEWQTFGGYNQNYSYAVDVPIPSNALTGETGMRIRSVAIGNPNDSTDACTTFGSGETEDFRITIQVPGPTPCVNPPDAGTAISTDYDVCSTDSFTLSLSGNTNGFGQVFQWQSSPNNISWTSISGATQETLAYSQSAQTYYRCLSWCGHFDTTNVVTITQNPASACFCIPVSAGAACITDVTFNTISGVSGPGCSANNYTFHTASTTVVQGDSLPISVTVEDFASISLWIDFNHDYVLDSLEWFEINSIASPATPNIPTVKYIKIPQNAVAAQSLMRVRSRLSLFSYPNGPSDACDYFDSGEAEDFILTIDSLPACTNPPLAGDALASIDSACVASVFTLSMINSSTGTGQTYQWQSSQNNTTWTNIVGATSKFYSTSQSVSTYYRCMLSCSGSDTTNVVFVPQKNFLDCYCEPYSYGYECITHVEFDSILHNSGNACSAPSYGLYTSYTTTVNAGDTVPIYVGASFLAVLSVWIDFDQNGIFESDEWTAINGYSTTYNYPTADIIIPSNALPGVTRMRVRSMASGNDNYGPNACDYSGSGEVEDYLITIHQNLPSISAGPDIVLCVGNQIYLNATLPANTSGTWTKISGAGTIISPNSPTSQIKNIPFGGSGVFVWTVTYNNIPLTDTVEIRRPEIPTNIVTTNVGNNSVTFSWTAVTSPDSFWIRLGDNCSSSIGANYKVPGYMRSYTINNLKGCTNYCIKIRTQCSTSSGFVYSAYSPNTSFTTSGPAPCTVVNGFTVSGVQGCTYNVSWANGCVAADSFRVRYRKGTNPFVNSSFTTANNINLNLSVGTWEIRIQTWCNGTVVGLSPAGVYYTISDCSMPYAVSLAQNSGCNYKVQWETCGVSDSFRVRYRTGSNAYANTAFTTNNYISLNLAPGSWDFRVQNWCGNAVAGLTNPYNFNIASCRMAGIQEPATNLVLFPNPTSSKSLLNFNSAIEGAYVLTFTDLSGRVLKSIEGSAILGENTAEISAEGFSKGVYFVGLTLNGETRQIKLIVQ